MCECVYVGVCVCVCECVCVYVGVCVCVWTGAMNHILLMWSQYWFEPSWYNLSGQKVELWNSGLRFRQHDTMSARRDKPLEKFDLENLGQVHEVHIPNGPV